MDPLSSSNVHSEVEDNKMNLETEKVTLGPSQQSFEGRYPLTLLGEVDQMYRKPTSLPISPFEFNQEVVSVFDDMVSR